jgi:hypothetical protein
VYDDASAASAASLASLAPIFSVPLNSERDMLSVYPHNVHNLLRLQSVTSFHRLSAGDVANIASLVQLHGSGRR